METLPAHDRNEVFALKRVFFFIAASIFLVELGIMFFFETFSEMSPVVEGIVDATLLSAVTFSVLYAFIFRPTMRQMTWMRLQSTALKSAANGIFITDKNGIIQWVNPAFTTLTGFSSEEAIGKTPRILKSGREQPEYYTRLWTTILAGKPWRSGVVDKRKDGSLFTLDQIITPVKDDRGAVTHFVAIQHDITREREIDQEKTEFVSLAGHQLRTPLTTVGWYTEMLLAGDAGQLTEKQKHYLDEIDGGNRRMVELVNSLLNSSRIEAGTFGIEPQQVYIRDIIETILKDIAVDVDTKKLHIETTYNDVDGIIADPKLLRMVFQNLFANAVQYTPAGGTITWVAAKHPPDIQFTVTDTGIGIPAASRDKIFTKLYRADNARSVSPDGTGLGLYMVKSILDRAGGRIWFESHEGKGSTFYVTIPEAGMQKKEGTKTLV